jgi:hypothetical protein
MSHPNIKWLQEHIVDSFPAEAASKAPADDSQPTPFQVLALPISARADAIIARGHELAAQAATEQQRQQISWAVEALSASGSERRAHELREHARRLELQIACARLLAHLFPGSVWNVAEIGRYHFLAQVLDQSPALRDELIDSARPQVVSRLWAEILASQCSNPCFLHGFAVLLCEKMLAAARDRADERAYQASTALWVLLLAADEFWAYFSVERFTPRESSERRPLDDQQRASLEQSAIRLILTPHITIANHEFAATRYPAASIHLRCLDMCRVGQQALFAAVEQYGLPVVLTLNNERLQHAAAIAAELLDQWGAGQVREAEKILNDPDAIKHLPSGIRKNYARAIEYLHPYLELNISLARVLRAGLAWCNDWAYDLRVTKNKQQVAAILQQADQFAERLAPLCTKQLGHQLENQVLSQHFLVRGVTNIGDLEQATRDFYEALDWNPANDFAVKNLSYTLVNRAGQLVANAQGACNMLKAARDDIFESVRQLESYGRGYYGLTTTNRKCAVCHEHRVGGQGQAYGHGPLIKQLLDPKHNIRSMMAIRPEQFWRTYEYHLCGDCVAKLDLIADSHYQATDLLTEAVRVDKDNEEARRYLWMQRLYSRFAVGHLHDPVRKTQPVPGAASADARTD